MSPVYLEDEWKKERAELHKLLRLSRTVMTQGTDKQLAAAAVLITTYLKRGGELTPIPDNLKVFWESIVDET